MKLIDAEDFEQRTKERFKRPSEALVIGQSNYTGELTDMEYFDWWLNQQPEVEAEPVKHGRWQDEHVSLMKWIPEEEDGVKPEDVEAESMSEIQCSVCKLWAVKFTRHRAYELCPYCGSRMDGDAK